MKLIDFFQLFSKHILISLTLSSVLLLQACGGGGGEENGTGDNEAPLAKITFPTHQSLTESNTLTVHGTASDENEISVVRVNGVDAQSTDKFLNWSAEISLNPGDNQLNVETVDVFNNSNIGAAQVIVKNQARLVSPFSMAFDELSKQALVVEGEGNAIVSVDLASGNRFLVSPQVQIVNSVHLAVGHLVVDGNRALGTDAGFFRAGNIIEINLATGARSIFSANTTAETLTTPKGIAIYDGNAVVLDNDSNTLVAVDLLTSKRTILSDATQTPEFVATTGFVITETGEALVLDFTLKAVISIDLSTGIRTVLSDNTAPASQVFFNAPVEMAYDAGNNQVLIIDSGSNQIISVDISNGNRAVFSDIVTNDASITWLELKSLIIDNINKKALVLDIGLQSIVSADLNTGARTPVTTYKTPAADFAWDVIRAIAYDSINDRLLVLDTGNYVPTRGAYQVNTSTGERSLFASLSDPNGDINLSTGIIDMLVDVKRNRVLMLNSGNAAIVAIDLDADVRTVLTDDSNTGPILSTPRSLAFDSTNNTAYVLEGRTVITLIKIDLSTGERTILSSNDTVSSTVDFKDPTALVVDAKNKRLLVTDNSLNAVLAVDVVTGVRTILSADGVPNSVNKISLPNDIEIDVEKNRALVADNSGRKIIAVDLTSGARSILTEVSDSNSDNHSGNVFRISFDKINNNIFILGDTSRFIGSSNFSLITLARADTGKRVMFTK
ncbi:MAG: hypothetical protein QM500_12025 [Methylococcales bacterium]